MSATLRHLGTGWAFPLRPDPASGGVGYRSGAEKVRESIELILSTEPGERLMRPAFGCPLRTFLMAPNTVATRAAIQRAVSRAVEAFEPRVRLREVTATPGDAASEDASLVQITVRYEHRRDGSPGVMVYPFYLERA